MQLCQVAGSSAWLGTTCRCTSHLRAAARTFRASKTPHDPPQTAEICRAKAAESKYNFCSRPQCSEPKRMPKKRIGSIEGSSALEVGQRSDRFTAWHTRPLWLPPRQFGRIAHATYRHLPTRHSYNFSLDPNLGHAGNLTRTQFCIRVPLSGQPGNCGSLSTRYAAESDWNFACASSSPGFLS